MTEQAIVTSAEGTVDDANTAIAAARAEVELGAWRLRSGSQHGVWLNTFVALVARGAEVLTDMDAGCIGRVLVEPRLPDLPNAIAPLRHAAGWPDDVEGRTIPTGGDMERATRSYTPLEPVGVVGAVVPWNTPQITC